MLFRSQAQQAMTRDVVFVTPAYTLATAYRWMATWKVRHLPVVSGGRLVGILSDRDVLIHASRVSGEVVIPHMTVADAMTESPISIQRSTTVSKAAELMIEYKIDALPVVDGSDRLIGLVTSTDLLILLIGDNDSVTGRVLPWDFSLRDAGAASAVA